MTSIGSQSGGGRTEAGRHVSSGWTFSDTTALARTRASRPVDSDLLYTTYPLRLLRLRIAQTPHHPLQQLARLSHHKAQAVEVNQHL
jgi:hypothetical protein